MMKYKEMVVKSKEEIEETLTMLDNENGIYKGKPIRITEVLWEIVGKTIEVLDTSAESHDFDYSFLYTEGETESLPYVYFKKEWLKEVEDEEVVEEVVEEVIDEIDEFMGEGVYLCH